MCGSDSICLDRLVDGWSRPHDDRAGVLQRVLQAHGDQILVLDHENAAITKRRIRHLASPRLRSGERKRDRAADAVRLDRETCPSSELIGQGVLDKAPAIASPPLPLAGSAVSTPLSFQSTTIQGDPLFALDPPANVKTPAWSTQSPVLYRVGRKLVQGHRQRLHGVGSKHDVRRSVERNGSAVLRLSGEFRLKKRVKSDAVARSGA